MADWKDSGTIMTWIWLGALLFLSMAIGIILLFRIYVKRMLLETEKRAQMRLNTQIELLNHTLDVQETERQRIAAEIHDNLISELNVIRLLNDNEEERPALSTRIASVMTTARKVSHELHPPMLEDNTLAELMASFVHNRKLPVDFRFHVSNEVVQKMGIDEKLHLFRICQEVINNALKHADPRSIDIQIRNYHRGLSLVISDDGNGMQQASEVGSGLKNIASRAQYLNAKYKFKSTENKGTTFILSIKKNTPC